jgi:hypothetical protein
LAVLQFARSLLKLPIDRWTTKWAYKVDCRFFERRVPHLSEFWDSHQIADKKLGRGAKDWMRETWNWSIAAHFLEALSSINTTLQWLCLGIAYTISEI